MINSNTLNYNNFNLDFSVSLTFEGIGEFISLYSLCSEYSSTYTLALNSSQLYERERPLRDDVESIMTLKNNHNKIKSKQKNPLNQQIQDHFPHAISLR